MRQAVVVIHGIGEQRPMDTVRGFVEAVMRKPAKPNKPKFWSKPDAMSELFELRKLTTPQSREIPPTDFFEYYWAYQAEGTKFVHVIAWAWILLVRRPAGVPRHLRPLWFTLWGLILAMAVLFSTHFWATLFHLGSQAVKDNFLLGLVASGVLAVISGFILNYVGDAARYLNPSPANIDMRRRIRQEGITLLKRLHVCEQYDRIILVGHSLGSVIAYDLLRNLWPKYNTVHENVLKVEQEALHALQKTGTELASQRTEDLRRKYRGEQEELWIEERRLGNPWRVTDLITLGSPLAHAQLLMAANGTELRQRQAERELPTCPPEPDDNSYSFPLPYEVQKQKRTVFALHHGALFASTRWTNLYFPAKLGFFGDLVGGPLRGIFGQGIVDVAVKSSEWAGILQHLPLIHTHYWEIRTIPDGEDPAQGDWALGILREALELESRASLRKVGQRDEPAQSEKKPEPVAEAPAPGSN